MNLIVKRLSMDKSTFIKNMVCTKVCKFYENNKTINECKYCELNNYITPKKLIEDYEEYPDREYNGHIEYKQIRYSICPLCGHDFYNEEKSYFDDGILKIIPRHCPNCGQALEHKNYD